MDSNSCTWQTSLASTWGGLRPAVGWSWLMMMMMMMMMMIKGHKVNQVKSLKYLGLYIDAELKWDVHVNYLCEKVGRMISFLRRLRHFINRIYLKLIYRNVILPLFRNLGVILWKTYQLQKLQNRAGKIILKINPKSHFSVMSIDEILQWETLKSRQSFIFEWWFSRSWII